MEAVRAALFVIVEAELPIVDGTAGVFLTIFRGLDMIEGEVRGDACEGVDADTSGHDVAW